MLMKLGLFFKKFLNEIYDENLVSCLNICLYLWFIIVYYYMNIYIYNNNMFKLIYDIIKDNNDYEFYISYMVLKKLVNIYM